MELVQEVSSDNAAPSTVTGRLRVAVVVPGPWYSADPSRSSIDLRPHIHAFQAAGHDAILVSAEGSEYEMDYPVVAAPLARLSDVAFWREQQVDAALVLTGLRQVPVLRALREAGVWIAAQGVADGKMSFRLWPTHHYKQLVLSQKDTLSRLRMTKQWADCYLNLYRSMDAEVLESLFLSDVIAVETGAARRDLERFLQYNAQGVRDLGNKFRLAQPETKSTLSPLLRAVELLKSRLRIWPHCVSDDILATPIPAVKTEKVVAIGRWDSPQKDGPLLAATLQQYLARRPSTQVTIIGVGGDKLFAPLLSAFPQSVRCIGPVPREEIKNHLPDARIILINSVSETFPIAAHEALCLGATVVGPDVIPVADVIAAGDYGRQSASRSPHSLADALVVEMEAWEAGKRDPAAIAAFWRPRVSAHTVVGELLTLYAASKNIVADSGAA